MDIIHQFIFYIRDEFSVFLVQSIVIFVDKGWLIIKVFNGSFIYFDSTNEFKTLNMYILIILYKTCLGQLFECEDIFDRSDKLFYFGGSNLINLEKINTNWRTVFHSFQNVRSYLDSVMYFI